MKTKITILGAGNIGGSLAHLIVQAELGDVVLLDIEEGVAKGKALDISQAAPLWISSSSVTGSSDFGSTAHSDIIVASARAYTNALNRMLNANEMAGAVDEGRP